jgi:proline iminopeptidase
MKELPKFNLLEDLKKITVPTLVYCGLHDAQCPFDFSKEIHERLTKSVLYPFFESNHFPFLEEKEKFSKMVSDFKKLGCQSDLEKSVHFE